MDSGFNLSTTFVDCTLVDLAASMGPRLPITIGLSGENYVETMMNTAMANVILDSLNDGLYVCDPDRTILYWSKAAERITGWCAQQVVGHKCSDNILVHVDKDGRQLCGEEFCPLHRSIVTDKPSSTPVLVFGKTNTDRRVAMTVSVAPIHDARGKVIGGVEIFHDYSDTYADLMRARRIQTLSMDYDLPQDERVSFRSLYLPHDIIGGDYFALRQLDADHYGFMLADVMGHGVAAALHTMQLSSLWEQHCRALCHPAQFARHVNRALCKVVKDESFATALCGTLDVANKSIRISSAGGPPMILFKSSGDAEIIEVPGCPFGMVDSVVYDEAFFQCHSGDCLMLFSDGAIEIQTATGQQLGISGLIDVLRSLDYPRSSIRIESLHEALLTASNDIRIDDDLAILEIRIA